MHENLHASVLGATLGMVSMAVPDEIATFLGKLLVGVLTGLLSGAAYKLGARLLEKRKS
jgi:hypothetical protein